MVNVKALKIKKINDFNGFIKAMVRNTVQFKIDRDPEVSLPCGGLNWEVLITGIGWWMIHVPSLGLKVPWTLLFFYDWHLLQLAWQEITSVHGDILENNLRKQVLTFHDDYFTTFFTVDWLGTIHRIICIQAVYMQLNPVYENT